MCFVRGNRLATLSLITLALFAFMFAGLHVNLASANPDPTLYVDPPLTQVLVSTDFTVEIKVEDAVNLYAYDFHLYWTGLQTCIQCQATPPWTPNTILKNEYNNTGRYYWCSAAAMPPSAIPFTGATTVATLTFHCDGQGDSTLSLEQTVVYDVGGEVHHFVENGFVVQQEHDVAVVDISCSKTVVGQGYPVYVSVTVENQGNCIETFDVNAYASDGWIGIQTVHDLPGGEIMVVTFTWETVGFARGNYAMRAVADDVPYEADTGDNTLIHGRVKVTIQGDVTEDELVWVDMLDIAVLIDWFMTSPPYWNPNCDVNNDLSVDMADIGDAIEHFMQS